MILGSVQPAYLAWLPFLARIAASDVFVYLDDVEYSKNSFHNRNRIRNKREEILLTVPVLYKGNSKAFISQIQVDYKQNWQSKHLKSIQMCYQKAPYYAEIKDYLEEYYSKKWDSLADLNIALIDYFADFIGIKTPRYRSSTFNISLVGNDKLVTLCSALSADRFLVKPGTEDYHPKAFFEKYNIAFSYFTFRPKPYPQHSSDFIPYLSVVDFAMFNGKNSLSLLLEMLKIP